jgi:WD40 repeat protein
MSKHMALAAAALFLLPAAAFIIPAGAAQASPLPQTAVTVSELTQLNYTGKIAQVAYSPDGLHIAVAIVDGPVEIINATTFAVEHDFATQANWISPSSLSWGPKSDKVGIGYQGGAVGVFRVPGWGNAWVNSSLQYDVRGVSWSPDGNYLAAGIVHSVYIFWRECNCLNGTVSLDYGGSQPAGISWSHDSDFIAVGQQALSPTGAIVALFDAKSWGKSLGWRWVGPQMDNVAFEGRGRFLGIQLGSERVEVWEVRNWTLFANISSASGIEQFGWSGDGSRLVTLETEPSLMPNETEDLGGVEVLHLGGGVGDSTALGASPDGMRVALGYADGRLRILSVGGERLFDDRTPLVGTTGDPLTFSVAASAPGAVQVTYTDAVGGRAATADLTFASGRHNLTITVPSDWQGIMRYRFDQPGVAGISPERVVRILDNDAPTVVNWTFVRSGPDGETATATITAADNVRLGSATFKVSLDGINVASATAGDNVTASFSISVALFPQNASIRLELEALDTSQNGGTIFSTVIPLVDLTPPRFGADLSQPGTAGGRIQLGTVATDERGYPTVTVTWRELTQDAELPWTNFTYGVPSPGSSDFQTTFSLGRTTVAVEYSFFAVDAGGNVNTTPTRVQPVNDREPPEIVIDLTDRTASQGDTLHLGIVVRDNIGVPSVAAYVAEDGGAPQQTAMVAWATYGAGAYQANFTVSAGALQVSYSFFVTDADGNTVSSGTRTLTVTDNDPPRIQVVESVLRVSAGADFTFHVQAVDRSDISNLTVYYRRAGESSYFLDDFVADGLVRFQGVTTARYTVALSSLGISTTHDGRAVQLYFFALDADRNAGTLGSPEDPVVIEVVDGAPPVARLATVGDPVVGSLISFDGASSEDDIAVVSFSWSVDGVEAGNRSVLSWRFAAAGPHTVKLTVSDASGKSASQTQAMSIVAATAQNAPVGGTYTLLIVAAAVAAVGVLAVLYLRKSKPKEVDGEPQPREDR